jgi:hypothetical protein
MINYEEIRKNEDIRTLMQKRMHRWQHLGLRNIVLPMLLMWRKPPDIYWKH